MAFKPIKVLGVEYHVKEVKDLIGDFNLMGQVVYQKGEIKIDDSMPNDRKENVLIHELLHAMFFEAGLEQEEDTINRLANVLYAVLTDNEADFWVYDNE